MLQEPLIYALFSMIEMGWRLLFSPDAIWYIMATFALADEINDHLSPEMCSLQDSQAQQAVNNATVQCPWG
jgi:hypothetical protein